MQVIPVVREASDESLDWSLWGKRAARLILAACVAALVTAVVAQTQYGPLDISTDIVGFPAFTGFNVGNYTVTYLAWVIAFPVLALGGYSVLGRLMPWFARPTRWRAISDSDAGHDTAGLGSDTLSTASASSGALIAVGGALAVGSAFGLVTAVILPDRTDLDSSTAFLLTLFGYGFFTALVGLVAVRDRVVRRPPLDAVNAVNALAAPATILGLWLVSRDSRVTVPTTGLVEWIPWFPWWVAIPIAVIGFVTIVGALNRATTSQAVQHIAWMAIAVLALPAVIVMLTAAIPGPGRAIDMFHEGEGLAASRMLREGLIPWKDYIGVHGPLQDGLSQLVGTTLIQDSRWGAIAGDGLLWVPLYWVGTFALLAYVLRRYRVAFVAAVFVFAAGPDFASGLFRDMEVRFVLIPIVILTLALLIRWPRAWLAALFTAALIVQVVLTPETGYLIPACAFVVAAYEFGAAASGRWNINNYPRMKWCAIFGAVFLLIVVALLTALGALGDFVDFLRTFSRDHALTGGIPIQWNVTTAPIAFKVALFGVPMLIVTSFWYVVARVRAQRALEPEDWALGALALFLIPYFEKALNRADAPHVLQVWGLAFPLLIYVAARVLHALDDGVAHTRFGRLALAQGATALISVAVMVALAVAAISGLDSEIPDSSERFLVEAAAPAAGSHIGYIDPAFNPQPLLDDLNRVIAAGGANASVFDFSNSPALLYYLGDQESPTRYYHVSSALREETQADLISELRASRPELVVFDNRYSGLSRWDGIPNMIRHAQVSSYLLDHYVPLAAVDGITFLRRREAAIDAASVAGTPFNGGPLEVGTPKKVRACNWGRLPEFLSDQPAAGGAGTPITAAGNLRATTSSITQVELPANPSQYEWLEVSRDGGLRPGRIQFRQGTHVLARFQVGDTRPERLYVRIGSCAQWHWQATAGDAVLQSERAQAIAVRLIK